MRYKSSMTNVGLILMTMFPSYLRITIFAPLIYYYRVALTQRSWGFLIGASQGGILRIGSIARRGGWASWMMNSPLPFKRNGIPVICPRSLTRWMMRSSTTRGCISCCQISENALGEGIHLTESPNYQPSMIGLLFPRGWGYGLLAFVVDDG